MLELVYKFYANYVDMLNNLKPSRKDKDMKKQPRLNTIRVWDTDVNISIRVIYRAFFRDKFESTEKTLEYDFQMNNLNRVKMLVWLIR